MRMNHSGVIIIGSGAAALQTALEAAKKKKVTILTKSSLKDSNSYLAQGGIAAAMSRRDSPDLHKEDTLAAGRYYNRAEVVEKLVRLAPDTMEELVRNGMPFDTDRAGELLLGMEGAHSERRILHSSGDATGKRLMEHYLKRAEETDRISMHEGESAVELILGVDGSCIGVRTENRSGYRQSWYAPHIVLAAGGCGSLYSVTSNAETVSGDGPALALRAGARILDMEFIQFHPTLLYVNGAACGLISEAVRGEGAILVDEAGKRIMENVHPLKDLAPRHIVSQTIFARHQQGGRIFLDISMIDNFSHRFPTAASLCARHGIDLQCGRIPVAPGNHFLMGGIETDECGRTSVKGLYAAGECACTGVHGANRLASNSLLEGIVFGRELGLLLAAAPNRKLPAEAESKLNDSKCWPNSKELQSRLMAGAGIIRCREGLLELKEWLESYPLEEALSSACRSLKEQAAANALLTAWMITEAALVRTESRGGHFRTDYPLENDTVWQNRRIVFERERLFKQWKGRKLYEQIEA